MTTAHRVHATISPGPEGSVCGEVVAYVQIGAHECRVASVVLDTTGPQFQFSVPGSRSICEVLAIADAVREMAQHPAVARNARDAEQSDA